MSPYATTILTTLAAAGRPLGGQDLVRDTGIGAGRLYPALLALEADHLIARENDPAAEAEGRLPRRLYALTPPGAQRAQALIHGRSA